MALALNSKADVGKVDETKKTYAQSVKSSSSEQFQAEIRRGARADQEIVG